MSHGKVIALDTPLGIKRRYGVGYNLILEATSRHGPFQQSHQNLFDGYICGSDIPGVTYNADASNEQKLVYMVPFEHEEPMSNMLRQLESFSDITVALEMTSLEDAYLKIVK